VGTSVSTKVINEGAGGQNCDIREIQSEDNSTTMNGVEARVAVSQGTRCSPRQSPRKEGSPAGKVILAH
jgi:hypothetical protein